VRGAIWVCAKEDLGPGGSKSGGWQTERLPGVEGAGYDRFNRFSGRAWDGMRIAYMLTSLGIGGAERQVVALSEALKARGHAVALLVLEAERIEEWPTSVEVMRLEMHKTPPGLVAGLAIARRLMRDFQPDLIHSHTFPANMAARLLRLMYSAPVLSTIHNVYEGSSARMAAYRLTDPLCRCTTAVSHAAAERFIRLKAVPKRKCLVLTNGIDTVEFAPSRERREKARKTMGASGEFIWLAAGRIVPAKDYPNLLRGFAGVRAASLGAQLWIAGESSGPEAAAVKALAGELGLGESVRWLGLRRDMAGLLDAADGFVLASAWEGMPLAVGEAMAMEKAVAATDVGGVRELVGETGRIVPAKSPESLAQAMLELMRTTAEERKRLGRTARERIERQFSMEAKADEWEALYRRVLASHRGSCSGWF